MSHDTTHTSCPHPCLQPDTTEGLPMIPVSPKGVGGGWVLKHKGVEGSEEFLTWRTGWIDKCVSKPEALLLVKTTPFSTCLYYHPSVGFTKWSQWVFSTHCMSWTTRSWSQYMSFTTYTDCTIYVVIFSDSFSVIQTVEEMKVSHTLGRSFYFLFELKQVDFFGCYCTG